MFLPKISRPISIVDDDYAVFEDFGDAMVGVEDEAKNLNEVQHARSF